MKTCSWCSDDNAVCTVETAISVYLYCELCAAEVMQRYTARRVPFDVSWLDEELKLSAEAAP